MVYVYVSSSSKSKFIEITFEKIKRHSCVISIWRHFPNQSNESFVCSFKGMWFSIFDFFCVCVYIYQQCHTQINSFAFWFTLGVTMIFLQVQWPCLKCRLVVTTMMVSYHDKRKGERQEVLLDWWCEGKYFVFKTPRQPQHTHSKIEAPAFCGVLILQRGTLKTS
jgi:hypothetical protein